MPPESAPHEMPARPSALSRLQRRLELSWRRQSPAGQDALAALGPMISVLLFLAAIIFAFWYLRNEQGERETDSVKRDVETTQQQIRLNLIQNQEQLIRLARAIVDREVDSNGFLNQAVGFTRDRPEITHLIWVDANRVAKAGDAAESRSDTAIPTLPSAGRDTDAELTFRTASTTRLPAYSRAFADSAGAAVFQLHVPLIEQGNFVGALIAEYSIDGLMRRSVSKDILSRHPITLLDDKDRIYASTVTPMPGTKATQPSIVYQLPLAPAANGLILRGQGYRTSIGLISNTLFWMVAALSVLTVWLLLGTWRHMRRRLQMQSSLVSETNFRRAMENSMMTGMRATDLEGRITYVNPAFSAMTGFDEAELVGRKPPLPYWPLDRLEEYARLLQQELQGRSPSGGTEIKVMRKDGSVFNARTYVSPLIDPKGQQTGWMTSMTTLTDAKLRDEDTGHGGYIFLDLRDDHKAVFHDVLKGFEEYAKLKGYSISFSVDGSVSNKIGFKFTVLPSSPPVTEYTVQDDLKEYIRRVQAGDVDLSDLPRVVPLEQHEALLLVMRNRIIFLQHTYRAQRNVLDFYERVLKEANPRSAGIAQAQTFFLQAGGDMSSRSYTAVGSNRVVQGDNNEVDQSVHVARSFNEKKQQLDNLDQLIAALAQAASGESAKKAVLSLEKVKDELTEERAPDEGRITRWLHMARDSIKALGLGKDLVDLASKTFESFNIAF